MYLLTLVQHTQHYWYTKLDKQTSKQTNNILNKSMKQDGSQTKRLTS